MSGWLIFLSNTSDKPMLGTFFKLASVKLLFDSHTVVLPFTALIAARRSVFPNLLNNAHHTFETAAAVIDCCSLCYFFIV